MPRKGSIRRELILDRLFGSISYRVVVMQAPAGHGKSTVMHQVKTACEGAGCLTAWLTFDEADNDTRRFLIHFQALLNALRGGAATPQELPTEEIEESSRRRRSDWIIDRLMGFTQPVALFFDDFQLIENATILGLFRELLEHVPDHTRIFIGSRSLPELGLARLVVNAQALLLRPEDLRFSPAEVQQFFAADPGGDPSDVTEGELAAIYRQTEGWPAALQLYRLSWVNPAVRRALGDFTASRPRELAEYLADNVLALQAPGLQDFLLRTALLTRLTAPLCNAVTGRKDSQNILLTLERSGLFVRSLDEHAGWFEFHALFASFLRDQIHSRSESAALEVHGRAVQWHLQQGHFEDAVHHAIACQDFSLAADTLSQWSSQLVADAMLITMERWCSRLPFEQIAQRRDLLIKYAWTLVFLRRREKLKRLLPLLEALAPPFDVGHTTDPNIVLSMAAIASDDALDAFRIVDRVAVRELKGEGFATHELGAAANLIAFRQLAQGDFEGAREYLAIARVQGERGDAIFSRGYTIGLAGVSLLVQGRLREALERLKAGMAEQRMQEDRSVASAALASCAIWALYEANELDAAEAMFGQYHDIIAETALLDFLAVAQGAMARIHEVRGRPAKALTTLDEAEVLGHANDWRRYLCMLSWERVRRALLAGDLDRARAIAAIQARAPSAAGTDWLLFSDDLEGEALGRIRLAIHSEEFDAARDRLQKEFAYQPGRVFRQIKLHLLDAELQVRRAARNAAHRSLRKALQLAAPGGYIRCFLDEGENILQLLREEYQSLSDHGGREMQAVSDRAFVEQVLRASGTDLSRSSVSVPATRSEPLTDREREILIFLGNGVSNKEMATRLFVSENTVKFHLKNIYSKLAVASRVQAIASARNLGLVH
ncbi:MAG: LuxR C-terminal-related transcriptional regulator [Pseudomonadota bacterium]